MFTRKSPAFTLRSANSPLSVVPGPSQACCANDPSLRTAPPPLPEKILSRKVCALTDEIRISESCSAGANPPSPANPDAGKISAAQLVPTTFNTCLRSYCLLMYAGPSSFSVLSAFLCVRGAKQYAGKRQLCHAFNATLSLPRLTTSSLTAAPSCARFRFDYPGRGI
jgi:hypothetical protein